MVFATGGSECFRRWKGQEGSSRYWKFSNRTSPTRKDKDRQNRNSTQCQYPPPLLFVSPSLKKQNNSPLATNFNPRSEFRAVIVIWV
ncbi:hypothetical protein Pint_27452 [Pistacia integerrima]|uniref:Uncharacterized protein n=1 Tax=Pistacia integerrima TaxID=434235 RepID=A0ACC0YSL1_9ROSI|nr:hypothetical protein Pint_27452 [Pistacia integerrima]